MTGGSSGIGKAIVQTLADEGCDVGFTFRSRAREASELAERLRCEGATVEIAAIDLADLNGVEARLTDLIERLGGIDILVNNAAINPRGSILRGDLDSWTRTLNVNLLGPVIAARLAARRMIDAGRGGRIINITSVLGLTALEEAGAYCSSKAGLENVTRVMAAEWAGHGITVNAVAPGHAATPMNYPDGRSALEITRTTIPLGRPATACEVAAAVSYLASARAAYTTGTSLLVDGGLLLANGPSQLQEELGLPPATDSEYSEERKAHR